jgi:hypothetical protein
VTTEPAWAPDSKALVVRGRPHDVDRAQLYIVDVDDSGVRAAPARDSGVLASIRAAGLTVSQLVGWRPDGLLFVGRFGVTHGLWRVSLDAGAAAVPRHVYTGTDDLGSGTVAADGRIFFASSSTRASVAMVDLDGSRAVTTAPVELTRAAAIDRWPSLSADGSRLAFSSNRVGGRVWVKEISSGRETPLPAPSEAYTPVISPDGRSVAYAVPQNSVVAVVDVRGGIPREICRGCARYVASWSADGQYILGNAAPSSATAFPVAIHVASGKFTRLAAKGRDWFPRLSPDQRWLSFYEWPEPDRTRQIIARYTAGGTIADEHRIPVTDGQSVDESAVWSADARLLYFTSERDGFRCLYASRFDPGAGAVLGTPEAILHMHGNRRTLIDTAGEPGRIDRAGSRLVFSMQEVLGNIWSITPGTR